MTDYSVGSTIYLMFTTRAFATGVPTTLAGTPVVSAYENDSLTQITAGITLGVDHDSVTGLNLLTIVATGANGYEAGKDYNMVITTGTVSSVSVVGEVVGTFSLERSAAIDEIGAAGAGLTEAGGTGDHLTAIDLPDQTMNITGNITGNLSGSVGSVTGAVGSVTGAVGSVTGNVGGNVSGSVGSVTGAINTAAGTITTLDGLDTEQDTQHATTLSKLLKYVQLILRKDAAIATDNATELTAINADGGSGAGAYANTTDSQEGIRDNTAWNTATTVDLNADQSAVTIGTVTTNTDMRGTDNAALASALVTAQNDLDIITGAAGVLLDSTATSAQLVDDIMDESITGANHNVNGSLAKFVREGAEANAMLTGTAQSATGTTLVLASGAVTANNILDGERVSIIEGTGVGQSRLITASVALTDTVTVAHAWVTNPDATSVYVVTGAEVMVRGVSGQTVAATAQVDFDDLTTIEAVTSNLNNFDPAVDVVANVTLVDTTTTNTDMRGTDSAATAASLATAQADLDLLTGADGATLATSQPNYAPSTHSAADVWTAVTRTLTANTNLNDITVADILTTAMTEAYPTIGANVTLAQALYEILQFLTEFGISGTAYTSKKRDQATTAATYTLDDATSPTSITRAT